MAKHNEIILLKFPMCFEIQFLRFSRNVVHYLVLLWKPATDKVRESVT